MSLDLLQFLTDWLTSIPQVPYPFHSRIHPLRSFSSSNCHCFIKRDDELGGALSGSKIRKYRTLIPFLVQSRVKEAVLIGSSHSNHILGLSQFLIENGILPTLFCCGDPKPLLTGNALFTRLFVNSERIYRFPKKEWNNVHVYAEEYVKKSFHKACVIPEGGNQKESFPGALTLALDIVKNEQENKLLFDHIFVDSGTGLTAIAVILGFAWLNKNVNIHVVLTAGNDAYFCKQLQYFHQVFCEWIKREIPFPAKFKLYSPAKTGRFGKWNQALFKEIFQVAQKEGFLVDPIYSSKLLIEAREIIHQQKLCDNILIIHSGGLMTLAGFQEQLIGSL